MSDELDDYFRCVEHAGRWAFQVGVITWNGPDAPEITWKNYRRWRTQPDADRLARARAAALKEARFFGTCAHCGALNNAGHMFDSDLCQGCAAKSIGIVY